MKKKICTMFLVLTLLIVFSGVSACGTKGDADTIMIGAAMCQTGIQAPIDEPALKGAQLAVDILNEQGGILGKKVVLKNMDGKSDPVTVGNVAKQLLEEGAVAIMAPSDFDFGGPASREANAKGVVSISPTASSPLYGSEALGELSYTLSMWNTTMGATVAEFAYNEKGWRNAYVITDDFIDYTKSLSRYFIARFDEMGGKVLLEDTYTQGQQDISAQLARLKNLKPQPDFVYISSYMPDLALMIRTLRENGIDLPVCGGDTYDDPALYQALGKEYGNNVFYDTHGFLSAQANEKYPEFAKGWEKKYGNVPDETWGMPGYDVIMVMAQAMEKAGSTEGKKVSEAMETTEFDLLTGKLKWASAADGHEPDKAAAMCQLIDGEPIFIGWVRPEKLPRP
ncbi:MAG TPA: ABC transporter substrate-binding protein [Clostridia bacterium]|nr:ABC transporter substrate-binding protein [Clostridia bacterium]